MKMGPKKTNMKIATNQPRVKIPMTQPSMKRATKQQPGTKTVVGTKPKRTINYGSSSSNLMTAQKRPAHQAVQDNSIGDDMAAYLYEDEGFLNMLEGSAEGRAIVHPNHHGRQCGPLLLPDEVHTPFAQHIASNSQGIQEQLVQVSSEPQGTTRVPIVPPPADENNDDDEYDDDNNDETIEEDQFSGDHNEPTDPNVAEDDLYMEVLGADDVIDEDTEDEETERTAGSRSLAQGNVVDGVVFKKQVKVRGGKIGPNKAIRDLGIILRTNWPGAFKTWREVPEDPMQKTIWDAFTALWSVPADAEAIVRKAFDVSARELYKAALCRARRDAMARCKTTKIGETSGCGPSWINPLDWNSLVRQWTGQDWQSVSTKNKKNRLTEKDGCMPKHTGGSLSFEEHAERMTMELGRVPTFREVYVRCHQRRQRRHGLDLDQQPVFVDSRAKLVCENYDHLMSAKYGAAWATDVIFDVVEWKKAIGDYKKGRMYGVGNIHDVDHGPWRTSPDDRLYTRTEVKAMIDESVAGVIATVEERVTAGIAAERQRLLADVAAAVKRTLGVQIADALLTNDTVAPAAV